MQSGGITAQLDHQGRWRNMKSAIKFRRLWDCCWGNETHVATFFEDDGVTPSYHAVCKSCAAQFRGETRPITPEELATYESEPRKPGDLCYNGYWDKFYLVLAVAQVGTVGTGSHEITVLWLGDQIPDQHFGAAGWRARTDKVNKHMTAWDWKRDKFVGFNMLDPEYDGDYADYDEFLAVMRDTADHWEA